MAELESDSFYEAHADYCGVCANANRLKILDLLESEESLTVTEIEEATGINQSTLSQHLKVMRNKGLLSREKDGVRSYYSIADDRIIEGMKVVQDVIKSKLEE